jgi:hypothetical protein
LKKYKEISVDLTWQATLRDGSTVNQFNGDGTKNKPRSLNPDTLSRFTLLDQEGEAVVSFPLDPEKRLFWRMRVKLGVGNNTRERTYLTGWRQKHNGKVTRQIYVVDSKGNVKQHKKWTKHLYPPNFRLEEEV